MTRTIDDELLADQRWRPNGGCSVCHWIDQRPDASPEGDTPDAWRSRMANPRFTTASLTRAMQARGFARSRDVVAKHRMEKHP